MGSAAPAPDHVDESTAVRERIEGELSRGRVAEEAVRRTWVQQLRPSASLLLAGSAVLALSVACFAVPSVGADRAALSFVGWLLTVVGLAETTTGAYTLGGDVREKLYAPQVSARSAMQVLILRDLAADAARRA